MVDENKINKNVIEQIEDDIEESVKYNTFRRVINSEIKQSKINITDQLDEYISFKGVINDEILTHNGNLGMSCDWNKTNQKYEEYIISKRVSEKRSIDDLGEVVDLVCEECHNNNYTPFVIVNYRFWEEILNDDTSDIKNPTSTKQYYIDNVPVFPRIYTEDVGAYIWRDNNIISYLENEELIELDIIDYNVGSTSPYVQTEYKIYAQIQNFDDKSDLLLKID